jgi:hypothetical protein
LDSGRGHLKIVRYEDLVSEPSRMQAELAAFLGAEIALAPNEVPPSLALDERTRIAMHGVRAIDMESVGKHRRDPAKLEYLRSIRGSLGDMLPWVSARFGYNITILQ